MLFPDHIAMTWCGGAKNVKEADWTPLSGRDVLVWPDADQPGRDAMQVVVDQLQTVGAASVKMILCPDGVPEGWDLADPVPEGLDLFSWLVAKRSEPNSAPAPAASGIVKATDKETLLVALRRMNETHFVGRENGRTYVYNIEEDVLFRQKRTKLTMSSFQDHKNFYLNRLYAIDDEDKFVSLGGEWLRSKERREYRGITLDPKETPDGYYNLWRGFAVQPEEGSWEPFKEHMFENLCRANQQYYDYLIRWCARLFQHPDEPGQVAVVIGGEEGAGKGFFARALGHLLGQHFIHISSQSHLVGKFNAHQRDAILMFADESFWAGDIQGANALKRLITEPTLMIEAKGKDSIQVPNMIHLILASNNDWIVPARWGARRFFVLRIGEKRLNDKPWFAKVNGQLKATGYAGFLHEMLNMDLVKYQVEEVLQTEWLLKQKQFTMESHEAWFLHKLESGNLLATGNAKSGVTGDWLAEEVVVETTDLHADYLDAMKRLQERYPKAENVFGMFLYDLFRPWSEKVGKEEWPIKKRDKKERKTFYRFPKLADCRKAFEMYTKVSKWEWPKDEEMAM
jgi:hypothetical protein